MTSECEMITVQDDHQPQAISAADMFGVCPAEIMPLHFITESKNYA